MQSPHVETYLEKENVQIHLVRHSETRLFPFKNYTAAKNDSKLI